jgi:hypothetical protein
MSKSPDGEAVTDLTYGMLDGDASLRGEEAHGPVIWGLELHPLLCYPAQLGQGYHLEQIPCIKCYHAGREVGGGGVWGGCCSL